MNLKTFIANAKSKGAEEVNLACKYHPKHLSLCFSVTYTSGGETGGSCWDNGDSEHSAISPDTIPDLTSFFDFLEEFFPNITYLQFRKLEPLIIQEPQWEHINEYYGNYTTKGIKYVIIADLHKELKKLGLCE